MTDTSTQDNCARAVSGTAMGSATKSTHLADCSSFFAYTITPATVTSTVTVTPAPVTETDTTTVTVATTTTYTGTLDVEVNNANKKRATTGAVTVSPSAVPAYASACSGTSRYSSACSCAGVTPSYITAPAPTTTVTVTANTITTTTVTTAIATATQSATYTDKIPCGQNINGPGDGYVITVICEAKPSPQGTTLSTRTVGDWDQCVKIADDNSLCTSFTYELDNKQCVLYRDPTPAYTYTSAQGIVFAHFNNG